MSSAREIPRVMTRRPRRQPGRHVEGKPVRWEVVARYSLPERRYTQHDGSIDVEPATSWIIPASEGQRLHRRLPAAWIDAWRCNRSRSGKDIHWLSFEVRPYVPPRP